MKTKIYHFPTTKKNVPDFYQWNFYTYFCKTAFIIPSDKEVLLLPCDNETKHDYTKCYQVYAPNNMVLTVGIKNILENDLLIQNNLSLNNVCQLESILQTGFNYIYWNDYCNYYKETLENQFVKMYI